MKWFCIPWRRRREGAGDEHPRIELVEERLDQVEREQAAIEARVRIYRARHERGET